MKKVTKEILESWWKVGWFTFAIASNIWIYYNHGWGIDSQFTLGIAIFFGVPMAYLLRKSIKKKEFRLKNPEGIV